MITTPLPPLPERPPPPPPVLAVPFAPLNAPSVFPLPPPPVPPKTGDVDKETIFKLIGKPFCTQIKVLYPFIAGFRSEKKKIDYFNNIVELFHEWEPKIKE
jgi:hypothetical protein